jgi:ribosomal protein L11 methyltransferase
VEWRALRIEVPHALADAVTNFLLEEGAASVITEVREAGCAPASPCACLETHLPADEHARVIGALSRYLDSLATLNPAAQAVKVESGAVPEVDWEAIFRHHHRPVTIGKRLMVAPPWEVPSAPGREILVIEPGMAFGTGQHATTRACLAAIEAALDAGCVARALDVGTGSGVLAAALCRLGVANVVALDADPAVLPAARTNLVRNRAAGVLLLAGRADSIRGEFDLVIANLLADALVAEARALAARVAPHGRLVLSGVLDTQVDEVAAAYPAFRQAELVAEDEWRTLVLERAS